MYPINLHCIILFTNFFIRGCPFYYYVITILTYVVITILFTTYVIHFYFTLFTNHINKYYQKNLVNDFEGPSTTNERTGVYSFGGVGGVHRMEYVTILSILQHI